jgi:ketosteroid isomerase-like protein
MTASTPVATDQNQLDLAEKNRQVVEQFFVILETHTQEELLKIFAPDAVRSIPYAPPGVGNTVHGAQAIYEQFSGMRTMFTTVSFPRRIYTTQDSNFIFVMCSCDLDMKDGGKYANDFIYTFTLADGKITEQSEYCNPFLMAKAFGIPL